MSAASTCPLTYQSHRKRGEAACDECREAYAEEMREYRKRNPTVMSTQQQNRKARERALNELARLYPAHFAALLRVAKVEQREENLRARVSRVAS